jgi:hypothetical protein
MCWVHYELIVRRGRKLRGREKRRNVPGTLS